MIDNANNEDGDARLHPPHRHGQRRRPRCSTSCTHRQEALTAHGTSDAFKALGAAVRDLAAGRPELTILDVVGGKGL